MSNLAEVEKIISEATGTRELLSELCRLNAKILDKLESGKFEMVVKKAPKRKSDPNPPVTLKTYLGRCEAAGVEAIPRSHAIFDYVEEAKIPVSFINLYWHVYKDHHLENADRKYKDWPAAFSKSVKSNGFRLWYCTEEKEYMLTSKGNQARIKHEGV